MIAWWDSVWDRLGARYLASAKRRAARTKTQRNRDADYLDWCRSHGW
jgi:hypothetical protein